MLFAFWRRGPAQGSGTSGESLAGAPAGAARQEPTNSAG